MTMRTARCWLVALLLGAVTVLEMPAAEPPPIDAGGVQGLDLKTQLEKGLRARRKVEFQYIDQIIKLVEDGDLPRELVTTTFVWAVRQPSRQLQYFQFALQSRVRAAKLNIDMPDLRKQAVGVFFVDD
jgi:hypothetical protein